MYQSWDIQKKRQKHINGINSQSFCPNPMKFSGITAVSDIDAWILRFIKKYTLRMRSAKLKNQAYLQPNFPQIQNKNLDGITGVYLTFKINR